MLDNTLVPCAKSLTGFPHLVVLEARSVSFQAAGAEARFNLRLLRHDQGRALIQNHVFPQVVKSGPDTNLIPVIPRSRESGQVWFFRKL